MSALAHASAALAESLIDDPFYLSITDSFGGDLPARKRALIRYFLYSLEEAQRTGRCVIASDPTLGAAAWLLPRTPEIDAKESSAKSEYLVSALGTRGKDNYYRIVRYMAPLAAPVIPRDSWYLSIIGVHPSAQGQGLGAKLLAGTLQEASQSGVTCYLETFTPRSQSFYQRLGFRHVATHHEPTTAEEYVIMRKDP